MAVASIRAREVGSDKAPSFLTLDKCQRHPSEQGYEPFAHQDTNASHQLIQRVRSSPTTVLRVTEIDYRWPDAEEPGAVCQVQKANCHPGESKNERRP